MRTEKQRNGTAHSTKNQGTSPPPRARFIWRAATCLLGLLGSIGAASADTYVCGTIAGQHWTIAGSPYRVTCNVNVNLLTIDPGVVVIFQSNYLFEVDGILTALGTSAQPITFTCTNGGWQGIFFNYCENGSELDYCNISAVQGGLSAIDCQSANPVLRSCVLFNNACTREGGGLFVDNRSYPGGDMLVQSCIFSNNTSASNGGAVSAHTGTTVIRFVGCSFVGNKANPTQASLDPVVGGGVYLDGNGSFDACTIDNNAVYAACSGYFCHDSAHGGGIYWSGSGSMRNTFIRHNTCQSAAYSSNYGSSSYGGGAFLGGGVLLLQNCVIAYNQASASTDPRAGGIYQTAGTSTIVNCTIAYNNIDGFRLDGGSSTIANSILYFNNGNGVQIIGSPAVSYSGVQNGYTGAGNISSSPAFADTMSFMLSVGSRCIDAGDPSTAYNDSCFPPSFGPPQGYTVRNDMGAYGGPGACCWDGSCTVVQIRSQPQGTTACVGSSATFGVGATGSQPITYQWRFHGTNSANSPTNIVSATNATYTISSVQSNNAGYYSAHVSNPLNSVDSSLALLTVTPVCLEIDLYAGLNITGGVPGQKYGIYSTLSQTPPITWTSNATITQTAAGVLWIDTNSPANKPQKYYKAQ